MAKKCTCKWCGKTYEGKVGMFSDCGSYCSPKCKKEAGKQFCCLEFSAQGFYVKRFSI